MSVCEKSNQPCEHKKYFQLGCDSMADCCEFSQQRFRIIIEDSEEG